MRANQAEFRIATMARVLGVSPSGYYAWRTRERSAREASGRELWGPVLPSGAFIPIDPTVLLTCPVSAPILVWPLKWVWVPLSVVSICPSICSSISIVKGGRP